MLYLNHHLNKISLHNNMQISGIVGWEVIIQRTVIMPLIRIVKVWSMVWQMRWTLKVGSVYLNGRLYLMEE